MTRWLFVGLVVFVMAAILARLGTGFLGVLPVVIGIWIYLILANSSQDEDAE